MNHQPKNRDNAKGIANGTGKDKKYRKVVRPKTQTDEAGGSVGGGGGGVSKIKAALRQTRRLLAKENISASVRQEADRKLIALEDELLTKEKQQVEKNNAQRYHKVRFFERQKLVRKIKKLKKAKDEGEAGADEKLFEERALLNYVLHYPLTQKYVALFPNQESDEVETREDANASMEKSRKVKERIIESMKRGKLSNEPEEELELRSKEDQQRPKERKRLIEDLEVVPSKKQQKSNKAQKPTTSNLKDDDFFATGHD
ncbi:hypothetical protein CBS101457_004502 [Exobasidium rhododendri]|nr:hypothetical protein CBS101457_004502 [Exobasidium rhododendri]